MFLAVCNFVAVEALPFKLPFTPPVTFSPLPIDTAPLVLLIVIGRKPFHEPNVSPDAVSRKYVFAPSLRIKNPKLP